MNVLIGFIFKYFFAVISCIYLFTVGWLFAKNRRLITRICGHFGYVRKSPKLVIPPELTTREIVLNELENNHFARYVMYLDIMAFVDREFHAKQLIEPRIIEFGGSNGFIEKVFKHPNYEIAKNYPVVDIQDLSKFQPDHYDFVILDQVLEHVANPDKAIREVYRVLKRGGWLINTTPFLVQVHSDPHDYWRFTKKGMEVLLTEFSKVIVKSWGNKETAIYHLNIGSWPATKEIRESGLFNLENQDNYPYVIWSYSRK